MENILYGESPIIHKKPIKDGEGNDIGKTIIIEDNEGNIILSQNILNDSNGKSVKVNVNQSEREGVYGYTVNILKPTGEEEKIFLENKSSNLENEQPVVETKDLKDFQEQIIGKTFVIKDSQEKLIATHHILNDPDGKEPELKIIAEGTGHKVIIYKPDGDFEEVFVENKKVPTIEKIPFKDNQGSIIGYTVLVKDDAERVLLNEHILIGKQEIAPDVKITYDKDENGDRGYLIIITNAEGLKKETFIKNEKVPTIEQSAFKDKEGNTIGTTMTLKNGDGELVSIEYILHDKAIEKVEYSIQPSQNDKGEIGHLVIIENPDGTISKTFVKS
ncbi:hypothetical protein ACQV2X_08485 [Facklamia sp. P12945]|uniref:hypothetical protein n=1 Tax=unclassified Facklamia TaxID=2622293 RepID=UPI003D186EA4